MDKLKNLNHINFACLQQIEQLTVPNKECGDDELLVGEGASSYARRDMKDLRRGKQAEVSGGLGRCNGRR